MLDVPDNMCVLRCHPKIMQVLMKCLLQQTTELQLNVLSSLLITYLPLYTSDVGVQLFIICDVMLKNYSYYRELWLYS